MSGAPVLSCVAALVAAYREGHAIAQRILAKRQASGAPLPPENLSESLARGLKAVEEAKDDGVTRFGPPFAKGDDQAASALRNIIIELQGCLIQELRTAYDDNSMTEFEIVVDASHTARTKAVIVLNELYMRMASGTVGQTSGLGQSAPQPPMADRVWNAMGPVPQIQASATPNPPGGVRVQTMPPEQAWASWQAQHQPQHQQQHQPQALPRTTQPQRADQPEMMHPHHAWGALPSLQQTVSEKPTLPATESKSSDPPLKRSRMSRFFSSPIPRPSKSERPDSSKRLSEATTNSSDSASTRNTIHSISPVSPPNESLASLTLDQQRIEQNPWVGANSSSLPTSPPPRTSSSFSMPSKNPFSRHRTSSTPTTPRARASVSTIPGSDEYNGFCKGAYYLQHKLPRDAFKIRNASGAWTGEGYYWACSNSKCCFEGPARHVKGRDWAFDERVKARHGVEEGLPTLEWRWVFEAKSHVAEAKVRGGRFGYRCIFCVGKDPQEEEGGVVREIFRGVGELVGHVVREHGGEEVAVLGMDRIVVGGEGFDMRFLERDSGSDSVGVDVPAIEVEEEILEVEGQEILEAPEGNVSPVPEIDGADLIEMPSLEREVSPWGTSNDIEEDSQNPWRK